MSRKQTKKKWIVAAALIVTATLIPAEASSPLLPEQQRMYLNNSTCGQKAINQTEGTDGAYEELGTCTAGSPNCCGGAPDAPCVLSGGGGGGFPWM
jgi:hypothetical protein